MAQFSEGVRATQAQYGSAILGQGTGQLIYVDSNTGNNANDGETPDRAVATVAYALTVAEAGDTIICAPRGSETVTATVAASTARVRIICPVTNPQNGYTISGAGTLDLLTVSAADVHIEGLRFAHTGATANASGILTTAAADRLSVVKCVFDDSAISATWTGAGLEVIGGIDDVLMEDCLSLDCQRGLFVNVATGTASSRIKAKDCTFFVGQSAAFGVELLHGGTGTISGVQIDNCKFMEADADGTSATAAWDGTDNTDATQGTIKASSQADQILANDCEAYTALAQTFVTLGAVNAGAASEFVRCSTGTGDDASAAVTSVGTLVSSALSATQSYGTVRSTANSSSLSATVSHGTADSTAHSTQVLAASSGLSATVSHGTADSTAFSTAVLAASSGLSATVSYGTAGSTANSSSLSATVSHGTADSTAHSTQVLAASSGLSATVSHGTADSTAHSTQVLAASSGLSATVSHGTADSTAHSTQVLAASSGLSATVSHGTADSTAHSTQVVAASTGLSATVSHGTADSTAHSTQVVAASSGLSATVSWGTAGSTAHSTSLVAIQAAGNLFTGTVGSFADTAIPNNSQSGANLMATADGDVYITEVILAKDGNNLTGPTNYELSSDNAFGLTGVNVPHAVDAIGTLQANENVQLTAAGGTAMVPFVLESGKKLYLHGDNSAGTSDPGVTRWAVIGQALSAGGSLS